MAAVWVTGTLMRATPRVRLRLATLFLNIHVWILLIANSLYVLADDDIQDALYGANWIYMMCVWHALAYLRVLVPAADIGNYWRALVSAIALSAALSATPYYFGSPQFISVHYDYNGQQDLNAEQVMTRQGLLLQMAYNTLKPSRAGHRDTYLIAAGLDGEQELFRKEALYAQKSFDAHWRTKGRSVVLANARSSASKLPLATITNIYNILLHMGEIAQPKEDTIILYLTSHGSEKAFLSTDLPGVSLVTIDAYKLRRILDATGFRRRVIIISACYSGSFIEPLKTPDTLIITAASKDRSSFGCSDENDMTWFADAFLKQAMPRARTWPDLYAKAKAIIDEHEKREKLTPSQPQIFIGDRFLKNR
jgi:hypothetical protein